ncbi:MAG: PilZ domain-containing protein [Oligoflexales bacterium]|nr:PilZ domain-containing protein [Oligoflexales bacterium]
MEQDQNNNPELKLRDPRFISHALIEVRNSKWWPFGVMSAILLDISAGGFKIELTGDVPLLKGKIYWLHIPLAPLRIFAPEKLVCRMQVRWFDPQRFRCGGILLGVNQETSGIIERIISNMGSSRHIDPSRSA